jgi:hypothetical protein
MAVRPNPASVKKPKKTAINLPSRTTEEFADFRDRLVSLAGTASQPG